MKNTATPPISLVLSSDISPARRWTRGWSAGSRVVNVRDISIFEQAVAAMSEFGDYIERIVIDHGATGSELLRLLHCLPTNYRGDVVMITTEWSYLSTWSAESGRMLRRLQPRNVHAYFRRHALTQPDAAGVVVDRAA